MYEVLLFSGGVYRFDELVEFVEDIGGMVLKKDCFEIIRGDYFLSEEIHVLLVVPEEETKNAKSIAKGIKGRIEKPELGDDQRCTFLSYLLVYDCLSRADSWIRREHIKNQVDCPCYAMACKRDEEYCPLDNLEKLLEDMCSLEIVECRTTDGSVECTLKGVE